MEDFRARARYFTFVPRTGRETPFDLRISAREGSRLARTSTLSTKWQGTTMTLSPTSVQTGRLVAAPLRSHRVRKHLRASSCCHVSPHSRLLETDDVQARGTAWVLRAASAATARAGIPGSSTVRAERAMRESTPPGPALAPQLHPLLRCHSHAIKLTLLYKSGNFWYTVLQPSPLPNSRIIF